MKEKIDHIINQLKSRLPGKESLRSVFVKNFVAGIAWGVGASIGLTLIFTVSTAILRWLGGLPLIGSFFADVIEATTKALEIRKKIR